MSFFPTKIKTLRPRRDAVIDLLWISAVWAAAIMVVNPIGDFPLNDDWSFGLTVKRLIENGEFRPEGWTSMPLITNVLWGALFCIPFGFSFNALRLSTIVLSLVGILGTYVLAREQRHARWLAVVAALTLAFNPIYFALSNTFMTDVPFTAILIVTAIFFARNLKSGEDIHLIIGTMFSIVATLSRQLAISVPLAFSVTLLLMNGLKWKHLVRAFIPPALSLGVLFGFQNWLEMSGRLPALYHQKTEALLFLLSTPRILFMQLSSNAYIGLCYLGFFLLPVLIRVVAVVEKPQIKKIVFFFAAAIGALALRSILLAGGGHSPLMPLWGNVLVESGIGPLTLRDIYILRLDHAHALPAGFWVMVTALSFIGAGLLVALLGWKALQFASRHRFTTKMSTCESTGIFLFLSGSIYLTPLLAGGFYDRYLVSVIPLFTVAICCMLGSFSVPYERLKIPIRFVTVALIAAAIIFSTGVTRDYLEWNRFRWQALDDLMEDQNVGAEKIDGGFEFNGLFSYDPNFRPKPHKSWWWVQDDTFQLSFGGIRGYDIVREYSFFNWIPPHTRNVFVLKKN